MSSTQANATSSGAGGAPGGAAGGGGSAFPQGPNPDEVLVYWLDIALLCTVGIFALAFLPRALARFSSLSSWTRGLILCSRNSSNPMVQCAIPMAAPTYNANNVKTPNPSSDRLHRVNTMTTLRGGVDDYDSSEQSHTLANHDAYASSRTGGVGKEWASMPPSSGVNVNSPPSHVPALSSLLHPLSTLFSYSVTPSKSVGNVVVMAAYLTAILVIVFVNGGNPLADTNRLGFLATSQIPVAVALGTKNNIVGMLVGMGYERLNFLHRWVGIVTFGAAAMHALGYIYRYAIKLSLTESFQTPLVIHGMIGLSGVSLLFFASLPVVRRRAYTLFIYAHIVGIVLFFVGICFHQPVCVKYVVIALGIYGFDHLLRILKTRISTARITPTPELNMTRIELPNISTGWRAGQHVRLRVLSSEMGLLGWSVAHPFTIASSAEGKGLVLMCKKAGGWTGRLYAAASQARAGGEEGYAASCVREMKIVVEGPYGGVGNMVMSSYSSVLLVAGGSGLTFALSQAEELTQAIVAGKSAVKFIELVWIAQDKSSLIPLLPTFSSLLASVSQIPGVIIRISVHYTRADKSKSPSPPSPISPSSTSKPNFAHPTPSSSSPLETHLATLSPSLTQHAGRPALARITSSIARLTSSIPQAKGLAVGVCGPLALADEVKRAVRSVNPELRAACGGVEVHEEAFSW